MKQEIMIINPSSKAGKKRKKTMAVKRRKKRSSTSPKVYAMSKPRRTRRRARKNPSNPTYQGRAKKYLSRAKTGARGLLGSLAPMASAKSALVQLLGALAVGFAAKKFGGDSPGGSLDNWGKRNYLMGALGLAAVSALADLIKKGTGKQVLTGGLTLLAYRIFTNEVAPQNQFLASNFGEEELFGASNSTYEPGETYVDGLGEEYLLGNDGYWRPVDESHRLLGEEEMLLGEELVPPDHLGYLGESLVSTSHLGQEDPYAAAYGEMN